MKSKLRIVISILLVVIFVSGIYVSNMFGFFNRGNYGEYSLKNTDTVQDSPIKDKTVIFLGSSVTYGYDSMEDTEPTVTEFYLLNTNKRIVTDWTKWDLSVLGKVVRVEFNLVACYEGYGRYGLVIPAYFAYDDVAVRFDSKTFK